MLLSPCIGALHDSFPGAALVLVAKPVVCELYGRDSRVAHVIPYTCSWFPGPGGRHDGLRGFARTVKRLHHFGCRVGLNTASDLRTNLLARLGGIGLLISAFGRHGNWLSSEMVAPELVHVSEAERQLEMVSYLLGKPLSSRPLDIRLSPEDEHSAEMLLHERGGDNSLIAAIHPGANVLFKEWPLDLFAGTGRFLVQEKKCRVFILGAPGREEGLASELTSKIGNGAYNLAGKTPVRTLLALLKRCALYIGNDSGPTHLAAAAACPTVAVFGATNPVRFGPYIHDDSRRIILSSLFNFDAIERARENGTEMLSAITVGMVTSAVDELWDRVAARHALMEVG